jgi:hypothetical protein
MIDQSNLRELRAELEKMGKDLDFMEGVELELSRAAEKKAQLLKTAEEEYLSHLREELTKRAGNSLSKEKILEITKSKESFTKAAMMEAEEVWSGMKEELEKMGCDEDFTLGIIKEAAWSLPGLGRVLMDFAPAARETGLWNTTKALGASILNPKNIINDAKSLGGAVNDAGEFLHIKGTGGSDATSVHHGFLDRVNNLVRDKGLPTPTGPSRHLEEALSNANQRAQGTLQKLHTPYAERQYAQLVELAEKGDLSARETLKNLSTRDNLKQFASHVGYEGGTIDASGKRTPNLVDSFGSIENTAQKDLHPGLPSPEAVSRLQAHAKEVVDKGFQKGSYSHPLADASTMAQTGRPMDTRLFRMTPSTGVKRALGMGGTGALGGLMLGGPMGAAAGGLGGLALGGLSGTLGTGGALAAGALGAGYLGYKGLQATGLTGQNNAPDATGLPQDRNRLVPAINNKFAGGVGGALLAALIASETGLGGPAAWLLPILGGVAGYNYFPQMMNKWKDPYGTGANYMGPAASAHMQEFMGQQ